MYRTPVLCCAVRSGCKLVFTDFEFLLPELHYFDLLWIWNRSNLLLYNFTSCNLVLHFHVLHFQSTQRGVGNKQLWMHEQAAYVSSLFWRWISRRPLIRLTVHTTISHRTTVSWYMALGLKLWKKQKPSRDGRRYVACDIELWPIKNSFCAFLAMVKTYTHTKN